MDQIVAMLVTLSFGTFILAGFGVKIIMDREKKADRFIVLLLAVFVLMQALSINFGYSARISTLRIISNSVPSFDHIPDYLSFQALFLVIGLGCLIVIAAQFLFEITPTKIALKVNKAETTMDAKSELVHSPSTDSPSKSMTSQKDAQPGDDKNENTEPTKG